MNIILCGFMGSGKSTVGKKLAASLNRDFIDLDDYIVEKRKMTIPYIFKNFGEENFRKSETQAAINVSKLDNYVIALGGGTVVNPQNAEILKKSGKIIMLNITADTVLKRLKNDKTRPLLNTNDKRSAVENMLEKRISFYKSAADYIIDVDNKSSNEVADEIIKTLNF